MRRIVAGGRSGIEGGRFRSYERGLLRYGKVVFEDRGQRQQEELQFKKTQEKKRRKKKSR